MLFMVYRGHLVLIGTGVITGFSLTPANGSEREALWEMIGGIHGLLVGDKAYISKSAFAVSAATAVTSLTNKMWRK